MPRPSAAFFALLFIFIGSTSAHSRICPDAPGESQLIDVRPGTSVRAMFFRARAEASYVEICTIHGQEIKLVFAAAADKGGWHYAMHLPAGRHRFYLKNYTAQPHRGIHEPWVGMRRFRKPYGYTFNWFDHAGESKPNTIVEFCLQHISLSRCPQHFPAQRAKNLARMSEYARERWLQRWMEKRGLDKLTPL